MRLLIKRSSFYVEGVYQQAWKKRVMVGVRRGRPMVFIYVGVDYVDLLSGGRTLEVV